MERVAIYLAGNIKKGHEQTNEDYWSEVELKIISEVIAPVKVDFLHPAVRSDDLSDQKSVFGRDMTQVYCSHVVFVDVRQRRGLGVGAEMMWAKMNNIAVVSLCPPESHYQRSTVDILDVRVENWIHPFVYGLSDKVAATVAEGAEWIKQFILNELQVEIKGREFIQETMLHYRNTQYEKDAPMQMLMQGNKRLMEKMWGEVRLIS